jgi:hypothetical protein
MAATVLLLAGISAGFGLLTFNLLSDAYARHLHPAPSVTVTAPAPPSSAPATGHVPPPTLTPTPAPTVYIEASPGGPSWVPDITAIGTLLAGIGAVGAVAVAMRKQPTMATAPGADRPAAPAA